MKTSELTGAALDWAVAMAAGLNIIQIKDGHLYTPCYPKISGAIFAPSTDWAQGGPIIGREIAECGLLLSSRLGKCEAVYPNGPLWETYYGATPLVAGLRCYVQSKLGNEVEVPDELL